LAQFSHAYLLLRLPSPFCPGSFTLSGFKVISFPYFFFPPTVFFSPRFLPPPQFGLPVPPSYQCPMGCAPPPNEFFFPVRTRRSAGRPMTICSTQSCEWGMWSFFPPPFTNQTPLPNLSFVPLVRVFPTLFFSLFFLIYSTLPFPVFDAEPLLQTPPSFPFATPEGPALFFFATIPPPHFYPGSVRVGLRPRRLKTSYPPQSYDCGSFSQIPFFFLSPPCGMSHLGGLDFLRYISPTNPAFWLPLPRVFLPTLLFFYISYVGQVPPPMN